MPNAIVQDQCPGCKRMDEDGSADYGYSDSAQPVNNNPETLEDQALGAARILAHQAVPLMTVPWLSRLIDDVVDSTLRIAREHEQREES